MLRWHDMMGTGAMYGGGLFSLLALVALIYGIVLIMRSGGRSDTNASSQGQSPSDRQTPMEILAARYARGEIDHEEFEIRRADLERTSSAGG